ncbi:hypothetical protein GCM10010399_41820 [Dactylosporangium fulvum]
MGAVAPHKPRASGDGSSGTNATANLGKLTGLEEAGSIGASYLVLKDTWGSTGCA